MSADPLLRRVRDIAPCIPSRAVLCIPERDLRGFRFGSTGHESLEHTALEHHAQDRSVDTLYYKRQGVISKLIIAYYYF